MWISKKTLNKYVDCINHANELVTRLDNENKQLCLEIRRLKIMLMDNDIEDVDFPNSKKGGFEGSDIFRM